MFFSVFYSAQSSAQETIRIAVASNFLATLKVLSKDFQKQTGIRLSLSNGATGMLAAQIKRGAPYDLFFAADSVRPKWLEAQGLIAPNSRFTYVMGKLVVWSPKPSRVSPDLTRLSVNQPNFRYIAIANPKTAPYGAAAKQVLHHYGLYASLSQAHKIAQGENVGKAFHYVASGNAQLGLIAKSYVVNATRFPNGRYVDIDPTLYREIHQQAVVLKGRNSPEVIQFLTFLASRHSQEILLKSGYGLAKNNNQNPVATPANP